MINGKLTLNYDRTMEPWQRLFFESRLSSRVLKCLPILWHLFSFHFFLKRLRSDLSCGAWLSSSPFLDTVWMSTLSFFSVPSGRDDHRQEWWNPWSLRGNRQWECCILWPSIGEFSMLAIISRPLNHINLYNNT